MTTTTTSNMQTVILKVGLHCDGCERRVKKAIWHLKGITSVDVDDNRERITVTGFVDPARILKAVKKTGKPVELWKYQNGNKNLYGSQPLAAATTPLKLSSAASKGNKVQNNSHSNNKYPGFQQNSSSNNKKLGEHQDRSQHPQPEYFSDVDSEFESFPDTEFYGSSDNKSDPYTQLKPPKNQKSNDFYGDLKPPKNQKNNTTHAHTHAEFKSPKNQKNEFYGDFKSPKNQKNDHLYSSFKPPNTQQKSSSFFDDEEEFKPAKNQKQTTTTYTEFKPGKNHQNHQNSGYYGANFKSPKEHHQKPAVNQNSPHEFPHTSYDESEFNRKPKSNHSSSGGGYDATEKITQSHHKAKASKSYDDDYDCGNHSPPYNNHSNPGHQKFGYSEFESEEKPFNQKKAPKSQMPGHKYVSFEDEYEPSYHRPQPPVVNLRAPPQESRGHEQKFHTTYGYHEQSYYPSYTYHESHRIPATNGFTMFSEENPNALDSL